MKQIVQSPKTGKLEVAEVPVPAIGVGQVLVRNHYSVMSPGTEKMAMDFARKSLLGKARSRPDLVRQVAQKLKHDGPVQTVKAVMNRLDVPQPLGYSCAGVIEEVGPGVTGLAPGDRVACAGAGYANHAEWVAVPENLAVRVPTSLSLDRSAFATLGAIALQGLRIGNPTLGEVAVVVGLGLIGQLTVQLLHANGCRVLGVDLDTTRTKQALDQGAEWSAAPGDDHDAWKNAATHGHGADLAIVAAASDSSAPIQLAAELCRARGRVVVVGATAMELDRRSFYEKELELRMSMSYGPGRYDRRYEEVGLDYPIAHVRWTEHRNLEAFAALAASGAIDPLRLDLVFAEFADAAETYGALAQGERRGLAVVFRYDPAAQVARVLDVAPAAPKHPGDVGVAFIGAGNYAKGVLLPAVAKCKQARGVMIVTSTGASAQRTAEKFSYARCGTDPASVFDADDVDLVFVATQHDTHAALAEAALRAGKAVWLEKPAGITPDQVDQLAAAARETGGFLALGYNRRFSPHAIAAQALFASRSGPLSIQYTVSAGPPAAGTWQLDPAVGGGRVIGEVCHFVDFCAFLAGAPPVSVSAQFLGRDPQIDDSMLALIGFADDSAATIQYLAHANAALPKERWEVSAEGHTALCDNFRATRIPGGESVKTLSQDKGQAAAVREVVEALREGRASPFSVEQIVAVSRTTFAIQESARTGRVIRLDAVG